MTNQYAMDSCFRDSCDRFKLIARQSTVFINQTFHFLDIYSIRGGNGSPWGLAFLTLETTSLNFSNPSKNGVMGGASIFVNGHKLIKDLFSRNTMFTLSLNIKPMMRIHCVQR